MFSAVKNAILKRNSLFIATIFGSAFVVELAYDEAVEALWRWHNKGVRGWHFTLFIRNYGRILNGSMGSFRRRAT